jgi:hypothetical protein
MRNFFNELVKILNVLSSSSSIQIDYLSSMSVDELGLEFDDIYILIEYENDFENLTIKQLDLLDQYHSQKNPLSDPFSRMNSP